MIISTCHFPATECLLLESPPLHGNSINSPYKSHVPPRCWERKKERDFCFHNNRSSLRAAFSDVIPHDEGTRYTHRRKAVNRASRDWGDSLSFAFSRRSCETGAWIFLCTGAYVARGHVKSAYLTRHVPANRLTAHYEMFLRREFP